MKCSFKSISGENVVLQICSWEIMDPGKKKILGQIVPGNFDEKVAI